MSFSNTMKIERVLFEVFEKPNSMKASFSIVWMQTFCRTTRILSRYSQSVFQFTEHQTSVKKVKTSLRQVDSHVELFLRSNWFSGSFCWNWIFPYFSTVFTQKCIAFSQSELKIYFMYVISGELRQFVTK